MPILDFNVQTRFKSRIEFKIASSLIQVVRPVLITKTDQPLDVVWNTNYFFGNTFSSTSITIWMMLLLRSGDSAMISDAAARATLIIAIVAGSIEVRRLAISLVLLNGVIQALGVLRYGPPSFRALLADHVSFLHACVPAVR